MYCVVNISQSNSTITNSFGKSSCWEGSKTYKFYGCLNLYFVLGCPFGMTIHYGFSPF